MTPLDWQKRANSKRDRKRKRMRVRLQRISASASVMLGLVIAKMLLAHIVPVARAHTCPNSCSGRGTCEPASGGALTLDGSAGVCSCFSGYRGPDCSKRTCPKGKALWDAATADSTAHRDGVECSGAGTCDTETGKCVCHSSGEGDDGYKLYVGAFRKQPFW